MFQLRVVAEAPKSIDLAKLADRLHMTPVHSKHEKIFRRDNSYKPIPNFGNCDRKRNLISNSFRQDAHKSNHLWTGRLRSKRIFRFQSHEITSVAERKFHFRWQLLTELYKKLQARHWFSNYECAASANIHDIVRAQLFSENAWTKSPVPSNVDVS